MAELTDQQISRMAKARVSFKMHAAVYLIVNLFLAGIWLAATRGDGSATYWPIWTHLGWGIGLAFHGFGAYGPGPNMMDREEAKLRQQYGKARRLRWP
jgi:hypothetical protein